MLSMFRGANKRTKTIWWALIIITVVTFVGGFVVLFGLGMGSGAGSRATGTIGTVNGKPITQVDYAIMLEEQRQQYRRQFGSDPADRDAKMLEVQTWRALITQRLMGDMAKNLRLGVNDKEVLLSLRTAPPPQVMSAADFQTNGQFDAQKYMRALSDPKINWSSAEALVRSQLPTQKLEQRLLASIKLSQPELREAFLDRYERVNALVVMVGPDAAAKPPAPTPADLDRMFKEYGNRFTSPTRVQLEALQLKRKYSDEDARGVQALAQSLVERARKGEDFGRLAKDYSEGAGAQQGGQINRVMQPSEFGQYAEHLMTLPVGAVSDPMQDGPRIVIIKILNRIPDPASPTPSMQIAQIVLKIRPNDATRQAQYEELQKIRSRAAGVGLGKAAAEKGLGTIRTRAYDANSVPDELYAVPEAADWGLSAKKGAVSPLFEGLDDYVIVQVVERHEGGPPKKDEIAEPLRQLADLDARVNAAKPRVDQIAAGLAQGGTLEQAAKSVGLEPLVLTGLTRAEPDPRLANAPEVIGALFTAPAGKVLGPIRALGGWYFARVDSRDAAADTTFERIKGQITTEILQRKQQSFFTAFVTQAREKAKIQDLRGVVE